MFKKKVLSWVLSLSMLSISLLGGVSAGIAAKAETVALAAESNYYLVADATGNTTEVDASKLVTDENITGYQVTTSKAGVLVSQTVVTALPTSVDTTGADKLEIAPVFSYTVKVAGTTPYAMTIPAGTYDFTVKKTSGNRCDVYAGGQMLVNNILQNGSTVNSATVKGVVLKEDNANITIEDAKDSSNTVNVQAVKSPSIVNRAKKVYVLGDSLVCIYYNGGSATRNVQTGWGQVLADYLVDSVDVIDLGNSGITANGLLNTAFSLIRGSAQAGDILVLESGYNDRSYDTKAIMTNAVTTMANEAKALGMEVVLVSPNASHHDYKASVSWTGTMAEVAAATGVKYIDLSKLSYDFFYSVYGDNKETVKANYNVSDGLHSTYNGANKMAAIVAQGLNENGLSEIVNVEYEYKFVDTLGNTIICSASGKSIEEKEESDTPSEFAGYSQDFTGVTNAADVAISPNAQDQVKILTDAKHGNYLAYDFSSTSSNSRGAYMDFVGLSVVDQDKYIVEFDAALTPGNNQTTFFSVKGTDFAYLSNNVNWGAGSGYILNLVNTAGGSTTYTMNATQTVDIPSGEWCHYKLFVDKTKGLVSVSITGESTGAIAEDVVVAYDGEGNVSGLYMLAGRYYPVEAVDNIVVRAVTADDKFGEVGAETLSSVEFATQLNTVIAQPAEGTAVHMPITVKANGSLGGDITDKVTVKWSVVGLENEDGYISLTKAEGTGAGTDGAAPDGATAYFNVRNGVSNYVGYVEVEVTYGEDKYTLRTPFAVAGATGVDENRLAPLAGYPVNMNDYSDSLVGYQGAANGISDKDIVLNSWSIYGSNGARTSKLVKDEDGTKSIEFASNGGGGSTVAVYQWTDQTSQYVIDFTAKFTADMAFGVYFNTPNNGTNNPEWTASYAAGALVFGTESISGIDANAWYRFVVTADPSIQKASVAVYDLKGTKLGEINDVDMTNNDSVQKYFAFIGTWPMYLNSFEAYRPTLDSMTVGTSSEVVKVPENATAATVDVSAILTSKEGVKMTGAVEWSLAEEYANVEIASTGAQTATLTVNAGASGAVTVIATKDGKQAEITIQLTTSSNVVAFSESTASITIPFAGSDAIVSKFVAQTRDGSGKEIAGGKITYALLAKDGVTETTVKGVTFKDGVLTVEAGASPAVVYVKATNADGLSAKVKVNIHGLSFGFGSGDAAEGFTQVADILYNDKLGYGFANTNGLTVSADSVTATSAYRFKMNVPNGNYVVKVDTTADSITSEVVEKVSAVTGITKTGSTFNVAVCDGVLDLTFPAGSVVKSIEISQAAAKNKLDKPMVYAIGDSTTKNNASGALSWGNCVSDGKVTVPGVFGGFANHGMAGRDSVNYYNQGRVEAVLLAICPGDYVTVNMGINSKESGEAAAYYTLMSEYYIEGILQRGGIPVIVTATPDGPVSNRLAENYNASTGKFTNNRGNGARNDVLRKIATEKGLNIIELGQWGQDWMNTLTMDDVNAYNKTYNTSYKTVLEMVQSWYVDHNHYKEYLGVQIGNYLLGELAELEEANGGNQGGVVVPPAGESNAVWYAAIAFVVLAAMGSAVVVMQKKRNLQ